MGSTNISGEVVLIFTGGTIGMSDKPDAGGVVPDDNFTKLLAGATPDSHNIKIRPVLWSDIPSPHMSPEKMLKLGRDIDAYLDEEQVLGAVILHGTDLMAETAYALDLTVKSPKPVIITGAMRYFNESGYDGIRNLVDAVRVCLLPPPEGTDVILQMADKLFSARNAIKYSSLNVDPFIGQNTGRIGFIAGESVILTRAKPGRRPRLNFPVTSIASGVHLVGCHPGMDSTILEKLIETGAKGIVLEGFGAGNTPPGLVSGIEKCIEAEIPVVLCTRCVEGGVWPIYAYEGGAASLKQKGVIIAGALSALKATILLQMLIGSHCGINQIKDIFAEESV
ncbi:asparaginase [Maridesulfovibrio hydrothermalis]|uniref:Putative Asparaginase/glutaminase n=1 Tax=Maridesulfovibrio hydrothermalis AM13 = DSM 14728 TaxID=1121451 RepID=L0R9Y1_9BACT|nr:asparaginase [Maridesulfovibrio hydrothermalis]CCO23559.1 putative Asparaginase/glutaminase [Maridesulfovibrio hydrothermalis AM13 = DSM 14728]